MARGELKMARDDLRRLFNATLKIQQSPLPFPMIQSQT
jgi:hypothetical protein